MKVGIIGSGVVAQALGDGFIKHGHEVMLGTREPAKLANWAAKIPGSAVGSFAETAKFGALVILAVKGTVASAALRAAGDANFSGKTIIDAKSNCRCAAG